MQPDEVWCRRAVTRCGVGEGCASERGAVTGDGLVRCGVGGGCATGR